MASRQEDEQQHHHHRHYRNPQAADSGAEEDAVPGPEIVDGGVPFHMLPGHYGPATYYSQRQQLESQLSSASVDFGRGKTTRSQTLSNPLASSRKGSNSASEPQSTTFTSLQSGISLASPFRAGPAKKAEKGPAVGFQLGSFASNPLDPSFAAQPLDEELGTQTLIQGGVQGRADRKRDEETAGTKRLLAPLKSETFVTHRTLTNGSSRAGSCSTKKGWPEQPVRLGASRSETVFNILVDAILASIILLYLALAIGVIALDGRPTGSQAGRVAEQATQIGPTIFPILFAAVVSRGLKLVGRYRAEQGTTIRTLWPVMKSRTLFETGAVLWHMRFASALAWCLALIWALSPVGGQASLRLLGKGNETTSSVSPVRYMDTGPLAHIYFTETEVPQLDVGVTGGGTPFTLRSAFEAAMMQGVPDKRKPADMWGNVKIPLLDRLDDSTADEGGWMTVGEELEVDDYSALVGIPVVGMPKDGFVQFNMETSYLSLACDSADSRTEVLPKQSPSSFLGAKVECLDCPWWETTESNVSRIEVLKRARPSKFLGPPLSEFPITPSGSLTEDELPVRDSDLAPRTVELQHVRPLGFEEQQDEIFHQRCTATQRLVETDIRCERGGCRAARMRGLTTDGRSRDFTVLDYWGVLPLSRLSTWNQPVVGEKSPWSGSMLEHYLNDSGRLPLSAFHQLHYALPDLRNVPAEVLGRRLAQLVNTAVQIFLAPTMMSGDLPGDLPGGDLSLYGPEHVPARGLQTNESFFDDPDRVNQYYQGLLLPPSLPGLDQDSPPFLGASATADVSRAREIHRAQWVWVAFLLVSSGVLLVMCAVGVWFGARVLAPDLFDPVMGLTYLNPNFPVPVNGGVLGAGSRAYLLQDFGVRVGDVDESPHVGRVGLGEYARMQPLSRDRVYE